MDKPKKQRSRRAIVLLVTFPILVGLITLGTVIFHSLEEWTWIQSFYFTVVTISTVGYGDVVPTNDTTRIVVSFFILIGVAVGAGIISLYGSSIVKKRVTKRLDENDLTENQ